MGSQEVSQSQKQAQHAELYLPVSITQSYNSLIPNLGVLVNSLTFFININRFCLKDKSFQKLSNQNRKSESQLMNNRNETFSKKYLVHIIRIPYIIKLP